MTYYEKIKSMSKEEMAKFLWKAEIGEINIPKLWFCDCVDIRECKQRNCLECYENFLDCEVGLLKHGGI